MARLRLGICLKASAVVAVALVVASSCNTSGCLENHSAIPLAEFYSSESGSTISLSALRISGVDAPNDSVLLHEGTTATQVYLPMRSTKTSTVWCLSYEQIGIDTPEFNDTIAFNYASEPYFASEECGAMYCYRINTMSVTNHLVDSVVIVDSLITNVDRVSLKIYFRTYTPPESEDEPEVEPELEQ